MFFMIAPIPGSGRIDIGLWVSNKPQWRWLMVRPVCMVPTPNDLPVDDTPDTPDTHNVVMIEAQDGKAMHIWSSSVVWCYVQLKPMKQSSKECCTGSDSGQYLGVVLFSFWRRLWSIQNAIHTSEQLRRTVGDVWVIDEQAIWFIAPTWHAGSPRMGIKHTQLHVFLLPILCTSHLPSLICSQIGSRRTMDALYALEANDVLCS